MCHLSDVNYSFRLTTTISPDQRQLLFRRRGAPRAGRSPPAPVFCFERDKPRRWESGKPAFGFPLFHPPSSPELWKCGNLACFWRDFQGARGKEWEACFWLSTLSTARHFHSFLPFLFFAAPPAASFAVGLAFRMLLLLGFLHPIARNIQLDNYAVMHQPVDRRRRHHSVLEDPFPF